MANIPFPEPGREPCIGLKPEGCSVPNERFLIDYLTTQNQWLRSLVAGRPKEEAPCDTEYLRQCLHQLELRMASMGCVGGGAPSPSTTCPIVITSAAPHAPIPPTPPAEPSSGMVMMLQSQLEESQKECKKLREKQEKYKEKYDDAKRDADKCEQQVKTVATQAKQEIERCHEQLDVKEKVVSELRESALLSVAQLSQMEQEMKELREKAVERPDIGKLLREKVFEPVLGEEPAAPAEPTVSKSMYDDLQSRCDALEQENQRLRTSAAQDPQQQAIVEQMQKEVADLLAENDRLHKANDDFELQLEKCKEMAIEGIGEAEPLIAQAQEIEKAVEELTKQLEKEQEDVEKVQQAVEDKQELLEETKELISFTKEAPIPEIQLKVPITEAPEKENLTKVATFEPDVVPVKRAIINSKDVINGIIDHMNTIKWTSDENVLKFALIDDLERQQEKAAKEWEDPSDPAKKVDQFIDIYGLILQAIKDTGQEKESIQLLCKAFPKGTDYSLIQGIQRFTILRKVMAIFRPLCPLA